MASSLSFYTLAHWCLTRLWFAVGKSFPHHLPSVLDDDALVAVVHTLTGEVVCALLLLLHIDGRGVNAGDGLLGEVARLGVRHCCIVLSRVECHGALQLITIAKHCSRFVARPGVVAVDGGEFSAAVERSAHVVQLSAVECGEVERLQSRATFEHGSYIVEFIGVAMAHVHSLQCRAVHEHEFHSRYVCRVQILHALDGGECKHSAEPFPERCGSVAGERGVEHGGGNASWIVGCPEFYPVLSRIIPTFDVCDSACACSLLCVVVEGNRTRIVATAYASLVCAIAFCGRANMSVNSAAIATSVFFGNVVLIR